MAKKLVVIAGQSNATGAAYEIDVTNMAGLETPYAAVRLIQHFANSTSGQPNWVDYDTDLRTRAGQEFNGDMGVELSLGRFLDAAVPNDWVILKMAIGGSSLNYHWLPSSTYPVGQDNLFTQFVAKIRAVETLTDSTLHTVIWIQGEEDATDVPSYEAYEGNLHTLLDALRSQFGSSLRFHLNKLKKLTGGGPYVRAAQVNFVADTLNTHIVTGDDLTLLDAAHYDANSLVTLGDRFGAVMITPPSEASVALPFIVSGSVTAMVSGVGNITPNVSIGYAANDVAVIPITSFTAQAAAVPAGWTAFADSPQDSNAAIGGNRLTLIWHRVAAGETLAAPLIVDTGSYTGASMFLVRGCATSGNPYDVTAGDNTAGVDSTAVSIPGDTTTVDDCLIVAICGTGADLNGTAEFSAWANADLTNVTEFLDEVTSQGSGGGYGGATGEKAARGLFGATTATSATSTGQARIMIAFRPEVPGGLFDFSYGNSVGLDHGLTYGLQ